MSPRQRILSITSSIGFLGNPLSSVIRLTPAQLPEKTKLIPTFLHFVLRRFRWVLYTGFFGSEPWSHDDCQAPILYPLVKPNTPRRLVFENDASRSTFAFAHHDDLLAGMISLESKRPRFSSRFNRMIVGHSIGEAAFPSSQGVGNWLKAAPTVEIQGVKDHSLPIVPQLLGLNRTCRTIMIK